MNDRPFSQEEQAVLDALFTTIVEGDSAGCEATTRKGIDLGMDPLLMIEKGLTPGIRQIGESYERGDIFLPEMFLSAEAVQTAIKLLQTRFDMRNQAKKATVVLGTVKGDIHDIGKNIVKSLLEVNGYQVIDLGKDVSITKFMDEAERAGATIIGMSGLLTTSLPIMRDLIQTLREEGLRDQYKVIIGGGPTSQEFADRIGADGYADLAYGAVLLCDQLTDQVTI